MEANSIHSHSWISFSLSHKIPRHLQLQKEEVLFSRLKDIYQLEDVMMLHPAGRDREKAREKLWHRERKQARNWKEIMTICKNKIICMVKSRLHSATLVKQISARAPSASTFKTCKINCTKNVHFQDEDLVFGCFPYFSPIFLQELFTSVHFQCVLVLRPEDFTKLLPGNGDNKQCCWVNIENLGFKN